MQRAVGLETELALGFAPEEAQDAAALPTQRDLFDALRDALLERYRSCEALYYKGGVFLQDGSLLHFEISQLEDPRRGLLEWATPECAAPREALAYLAAQERALVAAAPRAAELLVERRFARGRLVLLRCTEDRAGNATGAHESYSVEERPRDGRALLFAWLLHPLALALIGLALLAYAVPLFCAMGAALFVYAFVSLLADLPLLGLLFTGLKGVLERLGSYLVEPGPGPGQGLLSRGLVLLARAGGRLFSFTAARAVLAGHLPALGPFLATRPVLAGAGHLDASGRFSLTPRAAITTRVAAAFVIGRWRPLVDLKELFFRAPWRFLTRRKRLHLICGDANRCEHAAWLKLATTAAVLDALEAGALDSLCRDLILPEGVVGAFQRAAADPSLRAAVALDRASARPLTALEVQRRYLEAVWRFERARGEPQPERRAALLAWDEALAALAADPARLRPRCDWVRKLGLLEATLRELRPGPAADAWTWLASWGPANRVTEARCPEWEPRPEAPLDDPALHARLGRRGAAAFRRACTGLDPAEWPRARAAWLRLKALDLGYQELDPDGPFARLEQAEPTARVLDPAELERAAVEPPSTTRAAIRGRLLALELREGATLRLGWDRVEASPPLGAPVTVLLDDVAQAQLDPSDERLLRAVLTPAPRGPTAASPGAP
ncbi:MAG: proteasome accessory factor PafA2 family protein [Planctomycetota bacterium]